MLGGPFVEVLPTMTTSASTFEPGSLVVRTDRSSYVFSPRAGAATIGRDPHAQVQIDDPRISRVTRAVGARRRDVARRRYEQERDVHRQLARPFRRGHRRADGAAWRPGGRPDGALRGHSHGGAGPGRPRIRSSPGWWGRRRRRVDGRAGSGHGAGRRRGRRTSTRARHQPAQPGRRRNHQRRRTHCVREGAQLAARADAGQARGGPAVAAGHHLADPAGRRWRSHRTRRAGPRWPTKRR